jgi:hypothetical protein
MANPNPHKARQTRKERRYDPGDIAALRGRLWDAIEAVTDLLEDENADNDDIRKSAHCLAQLSGPYLKAVEVGEIEARLRALEEQK